MGNSIEDVSHIIELALAPAFLLVGVGSLLNVLSLRLGRIVDRARVVEQAWLDDQDPSEIALGRRRNELRSLDRRMAIAHWAISFCTMAALFVCVLVGALFLEDLAGGAPIFVIPLLFILAMALLIFGLLLFLVEVYLATRSVRVNQEMLRR
ncbi:MAG: DUF2721 domain-containing protein [Gammaproteobacteria bacterium]|nr:DUF2721 domain-containing protein [Gammaproteobacteria bacterium]